MLELIEKEEGIVFKAFILPKSSKNMISGLHDGALKIKLTAPPVDGAANKMCIKFLSKAFKVSKSSLEIVSGHTGRNKQIMVKPGDRSEKTRIQKLLADYSK